MIALVQTRWQVHYHLANLLLRFKCYEAAANSYGRALRIQPDDPHVQFQRAWSLLALTSIRAPSIFRYRVACGVPWNVAVLSVCSGGTKTPCRPSKKRFASILGSSTDGLKSHRTTIARCERPNAADKVTCRCPIRKSSPSSHCCLHTHSLFSQVPKFPS
jgi:hypothetical protein